MYFSSLVGKSALSSEDRVPLETAQVFLGVLHQSCCVACRVSQNVPSPPGTHRQFRLIVSKFNIETTYIDATDLSQVEAAIRDNTKV